jgi:hypothetical protein
MPRSVALSSQLCHSPCRRLCAATFGLEFFKSDDARGPFRTTPARLKPSGSFLFASESLRLRLQPFEGQAASKDPSMGVYSCLYLSEGEGDASEKSKVQSPMSNVSGRNREHSPFTITVHPGRSHGAILVPVHRGRGRTRSTKCPSRGEEDAEMRTAECRRLMGEMLSPQGSRVHG